jgi:hypothetical protein
VFRRFQGAEEVKGFLVATEENTDTTSRKTSCPLYNWGVHCRVHKSPPLVRFLRRVNQVRIPLFLLKIHSSIIISSMSRRVCIAQAS